MSVRTNPSPHPITGFLQGKVAAEALLTPAATHLPIIERIRHLSPAQSILLSLPCLTARGKRLLQAGVKPGVSGNCDTRGCQGERPCSLPQPLRGCCKTNIELPHSLLPPPHHTHMQVHALAHFCSLYAPPLGPRTRSADPATGEALTCTFLRRSLASLMSTPLLRFASSSCWRRNSSSFAASRSDLSAPPEPLQPASHGARNPGRCWRCHLPCCMCARRQACQTTVPASGTANSGE